MALQTVVLFWYVFFYYSSVVYSRVSYQNRTIKIKRFLIIALPSAIEPTFDNGTPTEAQRKNTHMGKSNTLPVSTVVPQRKYHPDPRKVETIGRNVGVHTVIGHRLLGNQVSRCINMKHSLTALFDSQYSFDLSAQKRNCVVSYICLKALS